MPDGANGSVHSPTKSAMERAFAMITLSADTGSAALSVFVDPFIAFWSGLTNLVWTASF